jgi:hypothetical protein
MPGLFLSRVRVALVAFFVYIVFVPSPWSDIIISGRICRLSPNGRLAWKMQHHFEDFSITINLRCQQRNFIPETPGLLSNISASDFIL